ncbi:hypothetical protein HZ326_14910 [Fusarium oxysporum f. sp. albedinis]|nr:hypothetical protein HZ326_14910 [Fusarium oxysporum f. sp. albedinis]
MTTCKRLELELELELCGSVLESIKSCRALTRSTTSMRSLSSWRTLESYVLGLPCSLCYSWQMNRGGIGCNFGGSDLELSRSIVAGV